VGRGRPAARVHHLLGDVAGWLGRLGAATGAARTWRASDDAGLPLLGEHERLHDERDGLDGVPAVLVHGDLGAGVNLLSGRASWGVVDWETARDAALPLTDLLPLLCGTLARAHAAARPPAAAAYVLRLCAGQERESRWLLDQVGGYLAATATPLSAAGRLAALAVGYQASMRLVHDRLLHEAGEQVVPWTSLWDEVARAWPTTPGLGRDWPALTVR
jgi:hypothetical protein